MVPAPLPAPAYLAAAGNSGKMAGGKSRMRYRILETLYGPGIRPGDWTVEQGAVEEADGLRIAASPRAELWRDDYPHGGGGDVEVSVSLFVERLAASGSVVVHFNRSPRKEPSSERGFRVELSGEAGVRELRAMEGGESLASVAWEGSSAEIEHVLTLATLGEEYEIRYGETVVAAGRMHSPFVDNEGWLEIEATHARLRLTRVRESAIGHDAPVPSWSRKELLYRESWEPGDMEDRWVVNAEGDHARPLAGSGGCVFRHMSNCLLRRPFEGPVAVDYVARPLEAQGYSAGVTDAIFLWMADVSAADVQEGDLADYLEVRTREGKAGLDILVPHPLYWVDFGGSNNTTTRLRKNPSRHLMRQYTDPARLLEPGHVYRISTVQIHGFVEFWVDGSPMIRVFDPHPLTRGHAGVRAFCSDLELRDLQVWRIE